MAWTAYLELTDAAHWLEARLRTALDLFGVAREEFRLMVLLQRDGRLMMSGVEEKLGRGRESVQVTVRRAEELGWVRRGDDHLPPAEMRESRRAKEERGNARVGRKVRTIELTPEGERLIGKVLPKHESIVRAVMGELDIREMRTLIGLCGKLRREDDEMKIGYGVALIRASSEAESGETET
jgi:DNA-binding MarR family transcriptional regulator